MSILKQKDREQKKIRKWCFAMRTFLLSTLIAIMLLGLSGCTGNVSKQLDAMNKDAMKDAMNKSSTMKKDAVNEGTMKNEVMNEGPLKNEAMSGGTMKSNTMYEDTMK